MGYAHQTLRMIIAPHFGGQVVRLRFTNRYRDEPALLDRVAIARRAVGPSLVPGTTRAVRFKGEPRVAIPPGADVYSDAVPLEVAPFRELAVSAYFRGTVGRPTEHFITRQTNYVSPPGTGDMTEDEQGLGFAETRTAWSSGWGFLAGLDVVGQRGAAAVVALGDSITDGFEGRAHAGAESFDGVDRNGRYPDFLQRRLTAAGRPVSVVNAGISGNRLLTASGSDAVIPGGASALERLDSDVFAVPGVTHVLVLGGLNDLASGTSSARVIGGLTKIVTRTRARGLRPLLGTLPPSEGAWGFGNYGSAETDAARQRVNEWIRSPRRTVDVVDFDAAIRDPSHPSRLAPEFDSSDHVHPNGAGYRAMAAAVRLKTLRPRCGAL